MNANKKKKYQNHFITNTLFCSLAIFCLAFLFRLPFYHTPFWRTPDAIEYINVARNINRGKGMTQSIKFEFFDQDPVISPATFRPPMTYLISAAVLRIHNDVYFLQLFMLILGAVNCVLVYILAQKLLSPLFSLLAAVVIALNPNLLINNRLITSENIFYLFALITLILFFQKKFSQKSLISMGIVCGLSFLTRPEGALFCIILPFFLFKKTKQWYVMPLFFMLTILPYWIYLLTIGKNPLHTSYQYYFVVKHISEGWEKGFDLHFPTPIQFFTQNFFWILGKVSANIFAYVKALFSLAFVGLSGFFILFIDRRKIQVFYPLLCFAVGNFMILVLTWSMFFEPERHLGFIYILSIIMLFGMISYDRWKKKMIGALLIVTICLFIVFDVHRISWSRTVEQTEDFWHPVKQQVLYSWIQKHIPENAIIATSNPSLVTLFTNRPTIFLPQSINTHEEYKQYATLYTVSYVLADTQPEKIFYARYAKKIIDINGLTFYLVH